ncbi:MAG: tRNA preQ1(34) S-adenosylmethionine ribosyltransferase-isomerase QueA [Eubacteriaceae bacterium]
MNTNDFSYDLPEELIAQSPLEARDASRLMVLNRERKTIEDRQFSEITQFLKPGDLLVMNNTKVLPGRLYGIKEDTGGKVEILLLKQLSKNTWEIMVKPGKRAKVGTRISFGTELIGEIVESIEGGLRIIDFTWEGVFEEIIDRIGLMPVPPYIHETLKDNERYQTVYAKNKGSAAAPTAGLHFTPQLIQKIKDMGVKIVEITLHVGLGTFRPVKCEKIEEHQMHEEFYEISQEAAKIIEETRENGGRVIAVGTTSVRTLESVARAFNGKIVGTKGATDIFIYPGFDWQVVDAVITNFHLPESTLLMLISSFYCKEEIMKAYQTAINLKYRFFSFGDAMLIE